MKGQADLLEAVALTSAPVHVSFAGIDLERGGGYGQTLEKRATELKLPPVPQCDPRIMARPSSLPIILTVC